MIHILFWSVFIAWLIFLTAIYYALIVSFIEAIKDRDFIDICFFLFSFIFISIFSGTFTFALIKRVYIGMLI